MCSAVATHQLCMTRKNIRKGETGEPTNNIGEFGTTRKNEPGDTSLSGYDPPVTFTELLADGQEVVLTGDELNSEPMTRLVIRSLGSRYAMAEGSFNKDVTALLDMSDEQLDENSEGLKEFFKDTYDMSLRGDDWNAKAVTAVLSYDNSEQTDNLRAFLDQTTLRQLHEDMEDKSVFQNKVGDYLAARTKRLNGPKPVHEFYDSGTAYDETQTDDNIKDGDVLAVSSENVVGFLHEAWPLAVTVEPGEFHRLKVDKESFLAEHPQYVRSWAEAETKARELGYEI